MSDKNNEIIARITDDGRTQTLDHHRNNVSELSKEFASKIGLGKLAELAGLYHDLGKETPKFQSYIRNPEAKRGEVKHSIHGAKYLYDALSCMSTGSLPIAEIVANCITAHHGRLRDYVAPDGETPLYDELKSAPLHSSESAEIDVNALLKELRSVIGSSPDKPFAVSMITKLIYSCLIDADRLDAYLFDRDAEYIPQKPEWDRMLSRFDAYLSQLQEKSDNSFMTQLRKSVSLQCEEAGLRECGIYQLSVPTGGGKTLSSLRFALTHAKEREMSRIIYVIPYLSITEQTATEIRKAIGDDAVLEHHSNIIQDDDDSSENSEKYKLQTSRWDEGIIITTQVQFLESIFSAKGSDLRKLHNIANSVIIFDEVQSLPVKCVHLFNSAVNFLHKVCGCTVLLCTATQPLLDDKNVVEKPVLLTENASIAICDNIPERYSIEDNTIPGGYTYAELKDFIQQKHKVSTLVIVNTKAAAKSLFSELYDGSNPVFHLSTGMCKAHRETVFSEVKRRLDDGEPVICISTQLIEAGVDISFECVIRDIAGYDSILQAAGRCNRHGEFETPKNVYVVNIKGEKLDKLPDIKIGAEQSLRLFNENTLEAERIKQYYRYYFSAIKNKNPKQMDYSADDGSVYDLLTVNGQGIGAYKNSGKKQTVELRPAIRSGADAFYLIGKGQTDVIVPYGDSGEIINLYANTVDLDGKIRLLRKLNNYSVSLYHFQFDELYKRGALDETNGINILGKGFYDEQIGVNIEGRHELLEI